MPFWNTKIPVEIKTPIEEIRYIEQNQFRIKSAQELLNVLDELKINELQNPRVRIKNNLVMFPFQVDLDALMIAESQSIMSKIRSDFPNVAQLLDWNLDATLSFLKKKGAFNAYLGKNAFAVPCSLTDNYSKTGIAAWEQYKIKIAHYVSDICHGALSQHYEALGKAREVLVDYIWREYYKVLPCWPSVGQTNTRSVEVNTGGSYEYGSNHVVWNCLGWVTVEDKRPASETFVASFSGRPEIKLLILNLRRLREIEDKCRNEGIEQARSHIKSNETTYKQISWEDF